MERHFEQQLDKLKTRVIKMCSLVDEQVDMAIRAVETEDAELALQVIERDKKVDKYDLKIEKICQKIFALNQPVASDLRLIMSSLTINNNLERIGDIAVNICENFLLHKRKPSFYDRTKFSAMTILTKGMIKSAIDSFIEQNAKLAEEVIKNDDELDKLNRENHSLMIDIMKEDKENIEIGVAYLVMARQLERMGDHATNIAEDVYFIVEAQLIKHNYEKYLFTDGEDDNGDLD